MTSSSLIGYARISTGDQSPALQHDALTSAGCERIFTDVASGSLRERPELTKLMDFVRAGDIIVVWRLDRLGRSLRNLIETVNLLQERGVGIKSLHEAIDTSTPSGRLVLHVFASLSEFEREIIIERTYAGLAAARARGRKGGRPPVLSGEKLQAARSMYASKDYTVATIARTLGVSRSSVYRHLATEPTA